MSWTQQALDHFTDAALTALASHVPDLGSAWVADVGTWRINIDGLYVNSPTAGYCHNSTVLAGDQAAEITMVDSNSIDLLLRYNTTGGGQGYCLECRDGLGMRLWKFSGGPADPRQTQVGSTGGSGASGDTFRLEAVGTLLTAYVNGVADPTIAGVSDSDYSSGYAGLAAVTKGDDFAAYDQSGAAPTAHLLGTLGVGG